MPYLQKISQLYKNLRAILFISFAHHNMKKTSEISLFNKDVNYYQVQLLLTKRQTKIVYNLEDVVDEVEFDDTLASYQVVEHGNVDPGQDDKTHRHDNKSKQVTYQTLRWRRVKIDLINKQSADSEFVIILLALKLLYIYNLMYGIMAGPIFSNISLQ